MKRKIICTLFLLYGFLYSNAQTANAILFTENGEKFYVILNGLRMNEQPQTNVKLTDLNAEWYKMKIIFDDSKLGDKNFNLAVHLGYEVSYNIKKNGKGEFVLRPVSETPLAQAPPAPATQNVIVYNPNAPTYDPNVNIHEQTTSTTTTTTTGGGTSDNVNISVGMNVDGMGGGINMNVSGMDGNGSSSTTTTHSTTTTTTTHSSSSSGYVENTPPPPPPSYLPGYTGPIGCPVPMSPSEFESLKGTINSKTFEDTRMTIAKQVLRDHCLFVSQVKDLMGLFTFEETKLDFAKYAYGYTYDIGNYYKVNDGFTFESSIDDLNRYIESRK